MEFGSSCGLHTKLVIDNPMGIPVTQLARLEDRTPINVFVVSPNPQLRQELHEKLALPRWNVMQTGSGAGALDLLHKHGAEDAVLLLDPMLPDLEPNELSGILKERYPHTQILTLNSHTGQLLVGSSSPTPVSARLVDVINRGGPVRTSVFPGRDLATPRNPAENKLKLRGMIGDSEAMQRISAMTRMVAARDTTVLITGESGTGKDLVAQEIHLISPPPEPAIRGGQLLRHPRGPA